MKILSLAPLIVLAACSGRPAGESDFYDQVSIVELEQERRLRSQNQVIQELNQTGLSGQQGLIVEQAPRRPGTDTDLVQSLNQAIENAGNQGQEITALTTPAPTPQTTSPAITLQGAQPVMPANPNGISDNSFNTVVQNQTIETDRDRLAVLSQQTQVLEAAPLPENTTGVNLATFARSTSHKIGERVYDRDSRSRSEASRQCRKYGNPDEAQRAFLSSGGPSKDPLKIDPDGDGFVCGWSPAPFRNLRVGNGG